MQSAEVPPPPPPFRVTLNLVQAIEAPAPDYEPVAQAFEKETVSDASVLESRVLEDLQRAGDDGTLAVAEPEGDELHEPMRGPTAELEPRLGTEELPTIGSAGHWEGLCKPCAFMTRGCSRGSDCPFCHLCGPDERKKRRREKIAYLRELRRAGTLRKST